MYISSISTLIRAVKAHPPCKTGKVAEKFSHTNVDIAHDVSPNVICQLTFYATLQNSIVPRIPHPWCQSDVMHYITHCKAITVKNMGVSHAMYSCFFKIASQLKAPLHEICYSCKEYRRSYGLINSSPLTIPKPSRL